MAHLIGLQHDPVTEICDTRAPRVTQDSLGLKPAAQDWAQAQVHIPLRPDDELATASSGILESWPRSFVRAWVVGQRQREESGSVPTSARRKRCTS